MVIRAKAILTTEATNLQACPYCLSFKYHMRGVAIGSLEVFAGDKTSSLTSFWKKIGPQTQDPVKWNTGTMDIPQFSNLVITIVGSIGDGEVGDIAIDDSFLQAGAYNAGK
ncbi:MAM and LDL-receptor class A domain-containing protein 1-like [Mytilus californianus]|uniref:MAM and LDL-receptor class A domain-containing protein 1-like n=1 Tax=Mytilus californianus TaxID=6549 RepID=UPI002247A086|nr:MAM and LDL-receptor class A domain-containing protein 1-like [Mytilus californianus]